MNTQNKADHAHPVAVADAQYTAKTFKNPSFLQYAREMRFIPREVGTRNLATTQAKAGARRDRHYEHKTDAQQDFSIDHTEEGQLINPEFLQIQHSGHNLPQETQAMMVEQPIKVISRK